MFLEWLSKFQVIAIDHCWVLNSLMLSCTKGKDAFLLNCPFQHDTDRIQASWDWLQTDRLGNLKFNLIKIAKQGCHQNISKNNKLTKKVIINL